MGGGHEAVDLRRGMGVDMRDTLPNLLRAHTRWSVALHRDSSCGCDVLSLSSDSIASSVGRRTSKPSGSAFFFFQSPQLLRAMASGAWGAAMPCLDHRTPLYFAGT